MPLSAVDCVQPALQHTREQLFTRFRFGQWSRLALVGILAAELHVGGCSFGNFGGGWPTVPQKRNGSFSTHTLTSVRFPFDPATLPASISGHVGEFLGLILIAVFVFFVVAFVFLYINSIFRFILFDSVLTKQCSIGAGWQKWRRPGRRYFLWQLVLMTATWMGMAVLVGVPLALAFAAGWTSNLREHIGRFVVGVILLVGLLLVLVFATLVIQSLARDFLVPVMALENLDFADGWHRLLGIIRTEKGKFTVYLLLKLVLSIAAGILFSILAFVVGMFVAVPGVVAVVAGHAAGLGWNVATVSLTIIMGAVLLMLLIYLVALVCVPATVFFPAFALHFFASRYPALDALLNPPPPAVIPPPVADPPPVPDSPAPFEPPPLPPSPEPIG